MSKNKREYNNNKKKIRVIKKQNTQNIFTPRKKKVNASWCHIVDCNKAGDGVTPWATIIILNPPINPYREVPHRHRLKRRGWCDITSPPLPPTLNQPNPTTIANYTNNKPPNQPELLHCHHLKRWGWCNITSPQKPPLPPAIPSDTCLHPHLPHERRTRWLMAKANNGIGWRPSHTPTYFISLSF